MIWGILIGMFLGMFIFVIGMFTGVAIFENGRKESTSTFNQNFN